MTGREREVKRVKITGREIRRLRQLGEEIR